MQSSSVPARTAHGSKFACAIALVAILAALYFLSSSALAATKSWKSVAGSGEWSDGNSWSIFSVSGVDNAGPPADHDLVRLGIYSDGIARTITYDDSATAVNLNSLEIDLTGPDTTTAALAIVSNNLTSVQEIAGTTGRGTINQSGGTNTISLSSGTLTLGFFNNSVGYYNLSDSGALVVDTKEYVGNLGAGFFNQTGGTNTIVGSNGLYLGVAAGAPGGTYNLSAGSLSAVSAIEYIGTSASGSFVHSGGTNSASEFDIGLNATSTGSYDLSGTGLLSANNVMVGFDGVGNFTQSAGTATVSGDFSVARDPGSTGA